jgi:hypothetical protein
MRSNGILSDLVKAKKAPRPVNPAEAVADKPRRGARNIVAFSLGTLPDFELVRFVHRLLCDPFKHGNDCPNYFVGDVTPLCVPGQRVHFPVTPVNLLLTPFEVLGGRILDVFIPDTAHESFDGWPCDARNLSLYGLQARLQLTK